MKVNIVRPNEPIRKREVIRGRGNQANLTLWRVNFGGPNWQPGIAIEINHQGEGYWATHECLRMFIDDRFGMKVMSETLKLDLSRPRRHRCHSVITAAIPSEGIRKPKGVTDLRWVQKQIAYFLSGW